MKYRLSIILAAALLTWFTMSLVRVENERYALSIGMCRVQSTGLTDFQCLKTVETRTSWVYHLFYGLGVLQ
jgi:hypothetical protein